ncbi:MULTISPECIES: hypothetical protein [Priestia]|uniref:NrdR family transcriptional regulator n=1 Tax=Priestia TaxID=2800373 RepID=UPI00210B46CE|nr:hypothetical protein [Priestia aryabhattai]MEE3895361.1 hypothetical protein [Priestia megaterium]
MKCPNCGVIDQTHVYDSRRVQETIRRRRVCNYCNKRFKTFEVTEIHYNENRQNYVNWTDGELNTLVYLREQGMFQKDIGKLFGRSQRSVQKKLRDLLDSGEYFTILEDLKIEA